MECFVGKLIVIAGVTYRIYHQDELNCFMIDWNSTQFRPRIITSKELNDRLEAGAAYLAEDQCQWFVDQQTIENLPPTEKRRYATRKAFIKEVIEWSGEDMLKLAGKLPKPEFVGIYTKYGISKSSAFRIALNFAKNSPKETGLIDPRFVRPKTEASRYSYNAGRRFGNGTEPYMIEEEDIKHMEEAVKNLKDGKYRTFSAVYRWLIDTYYSTALPVPRGVEADIGIMKRPLPKGQRVSEKQFRNFLASHKEDLRQAKLGTEAYRNDCRRLYGRPSADLPYPGYLVEVDALDVDLNIVSSYNTDKAASRPTVYAMRDVLTGMILAVAVTLEKNSVAGVSRLIMNMLTDHVEFAARFGVEIEPDVWPSFVLPSAWRTDHGSDFMSKALENALVGVNVRKESAPPRTGSYKGKIEGLFNVFYKETKPYLEGFGLISKEYKGNDVESACITIEGLWSIMIMFVKWFNNHVYTSSERKVDPKMMKDPEASNTSRFLWNWWLKHHGSPRIADEATRTQLFFNLMEPAKATIQRDGIHYAGLIYDEPIDDRDLTDRILTAKRNAGKRSADGVKLNDIEMRKDPATVEFLYYIKDGRLMRCTLNTQLSKDMRIQSLSGELRFMTWDEYDDFRSAENAMRKRDEEKGLVDAIAYGKDVTRIVKASAKKTPSSKRNMRETHLLERQEDNSSNSLSSALNPTEPSLATDAETEYEIVEQPSEAVKTEVEHLDPVAAMIARATNDYKG